MFKKFLRVFLLLFIIFGSVSITHAAVSWSQFKFITEKSQRIGEFNKGSYDFDREELTLEFQLTVTKDPKEDYVLETEIGGENCEMDLQYDSPYIVGECVLDIPEEDVEGIYEIDFEILDEEDDIVYSRNNFDIEIEGLEDDFDWEDDLKYEALYIMEDQDLLLTLYLDDIVRAPNHEYRIYIDLEGKEYNKTFSYDESEERFSAEFEIFIDEDDIEDEYDLDYEIIDRDEDDDEVADAGFDIEVEIESNEDDFDWDDLKYSGTYDLDSGDLDLEFYLENIKKEPYDSYKVYVEVDGEEDDERFRYDEDEERFYAEMSFDLDEDDRFNIEFYVENSDSEKEMIDDEFSVTVNTEDDIDWKDIEISLEYDEDEEDLYITFTVEANEEPRFDYNIEFDIGPEDDDGRFEYQTTKSRLYKQFVIAIDEEEIEDEYDVEYKIVNDDEDDEVADDEEQGVEVEEYVVENDDIDWGELDISLAYDEDEEVLYVVFTQEISETPEDDYSVMFELDGDDYDEDFNYKNGELTATVEIDIDKEDIEDEYEVDYEITNEDEDDKVSTDTLDVDVEDYNDVSTEEDDEEEQEDTNTDVDFNDDWEGIELELEYHGPSRRMKASFVLDSFKFNGNKQYELELYLDDTTKIEGELTYSDVLGKMYGTFSTYIATTKVLDEYNTTLYILEGGDRIHRETGKYEVDFKDFVYKEQQNKQELSEERKDAIETAITKYSNKIFKKYKAKRNAIEHLTILKVLFEEYKAKNPKYADIVDHVNEVLEDIIDENK